MRGQFRIRTGVYGFADHRLNHSSNRPAKHIANVANYPFIEKIFIVFFRLKPKKWGVVLRMAWFSSPTAVDPAGPASRLPHLPILLGVSPVGVKQERIVNKVVFRATTFSSG